MLYFAYGANLNKPAMASRCPLAKPIGAFNLKGYKLVFRGVADIERDPKKYVTGALWDITRMCEKSLDGFEGFPHLYKKGYIKVKGKGTIMFYTMNDKHTIQPPSSHYLRGIYEGHVHFNQRTDILFEAVAHSVMNEYSNHDYFGRFGGFRSYGLFRDYDEQNAADQEDSHFGNYW